jgi:Tfp pilus assembly protein PilF
VESLFLRLSKTIIAGGAIALLTSAGGLAATPMQATPAQQPAAGQSGAAPQKNYKDRGEYDLYSKITQTQDPKARLDLLNQWQDKYPQSDFAHDRDIYFRETLAQLANTDPSVRQKLIDKCVELLKTDPKDFRSNFLIALWGPAIGGTSPSPDLQTQVQTAAQAAIDNAPTAFDPSKKPASVNQADFDKAKSQALAIAHNALAWVATSKKDMATAENEYKASLEANPEQGNIPAIYAKMLVDQKKVPEGLFEYAHAAQYTGPGALPEATRKQLMDYFNKAYKDYHGSMEGADQMLAQAKTAAVPPAGLTLTSQAAQAQAAADETNKRIASDPAFKIWYAIKQQLTGDQGDQFFTSNVKDAEVPGGAEGVKTFNGTVISIDPPDRPTKVVLGVEDPTKPDATLTFSKPLPASALDKIKVGQKIDFSGVADSYTKDPYMLTFVDPTIPGVQTTAPARTGRRRR